MQRAVSRNRVFFNDHYTCITRRGYYFKAAVYPSLINENLTVIKSRQVLYEVASKMSVEKFFLYHLNWYIFAKKSAPVFL